MPTKDMKALMEIVTKNGARMVLSGDRQQLPPIEAGVPFGQLQDAGMHTARMTEIRRQVDPELRRAVEHAARGDARRSLAALRGRIIEVPNDHERHAAIAAAYVKLPASERDKTLILAGTNDARRDINLLVRNSLHGDSGERVSILRPVDMTRVESREARSYSVGNVVMSVSKRSKSLEHSVAYTIERVDTGWNCLALRAPDGKAVSMNLEDGPELQQYHQESLCLAPGDWVRITRTMHDQDLRTGERYRVEAIDRDSIRLAHKKKSVAVPRSSVLHLDHGYASTVHSAQGATFERVLINADTRSATTRLEAQYVAISRPRGELTLFTDSEAHLSGISARNSMPAEALRVRLADSAPTTAAPTPASTFRPRLASLR